MSSICWFFNFFVCEFELSFSFSYEKTWPVCSLSVFQSAKKSSTNTLASSSFRLTDGGGRGGGLQRDNSTKEADPSGRIFRRGAVYRGIYLPSLSGKLQDERLEFAYLRYAHRQRQKSLMLVNSADIILKILVILQVFCVIDEDDLVYHPGLYYLNIPAPTSIWRVIF